MKNSSVKYDLMVFDANKFNIYEFWVRITWTLSRSSFYPFRFGETFYIHFVGPDNKVIISLPLKLVNWESYDFKQVISCYLILYPHIKKYLDVSDFSDIEDDYRPIVLYIGTNRVNSLNEVGDYLQDVGDIQDEITQGLIKDEIIQADFVSDIIEVDKISKELINDLQDVEEVDDTLIKFEEFETLEEEMEYEIVDLRSEIEKSVVLLKELRDGLNLKEGYSFLRELKQFNEIKDVEQRLIELNYKIEEFNCRLTVITEKIEQYCKDFL